MVELPVSGRHNASTSIIPKAAKNTAEWQAVGDRRVEYSRVVSEIERLSKAADAAEMNASIYEQQAHKAADQGERDKANELSAKAEAGKELAAEHRKKIEDLIPKRDLLKSDLVNDGAVLPQKEVVGETVIVEGKKPFTEEQANAPTHLERNTVTERVAELHQEFQNKERDLKNSPEAEIATGECAQVERIPAATPDYTQEEPGKLKLLWNEYASRWNNSERGEKVVIVSLGLMLFVCAATVVWLFTGSSEKIVSAKSSVKSEARETAEDSVPVVPTKVPEPVAPKATELVVLAKPTAPAVKTAEPYVLPQPAEPLKKEPEQPAVKPPEPPASEEQPRLDPALAEEEKKADEIIYGVLTQTQKDLEKTKKEKIELNQVKVVLEQRLLESEASLAKRIKENEGLEKELAVSRSEQSELRKHLAQKKTETEALQKENASIRKELGVLQEDSIKTAAMANTIDAFKKEAEYVRLKGEDIRKRQAEIDAYMSAYRKRVLEKTRRANEFQLMYEKQK